MGRGEGGENVTERVRFYIFSLKTPPRLGGEGLEATYIE